MELAQADAGIPPVTGPTDVVQQDLQFIRPQTLMVHQQPDIKAHPSGMPILGQAVGGEVGAAGGATAPVDTVVGLGMEAGQGVARHVLGGEYLGVAAALVEPLGQGLVEGPGGQPAQAFDGLAILITGQGEPVQGPGGPGEMALGQGIRTDGEGLTLGVTRQEVPQPVLAMAVAHRPAQVAEEGIALERPAEGRQGRECDA